MGIGVELEPQNPDGSFCMHLDGEADVRATYCALTVAHLCDILTPELTRGTDVFVLSCQSHEGGFAGQPGNETHGGYTFCGAAAASILGIMDRLDCGALLEWCARRQMRVEGFLFSLCLVFFFLAEFFCQRWLFWKSKQAC